MGVMVLGMVVVGDGGSGCGVVGVVVVGMAVSVGGVYQCWCPTSIQMTGMIT